MQRCLELARLSAGYTAPNPMVGCVIVNDDKIIGEGYTSPYGGPHAEVNAVNSVEDKTLLPHSILYVSLEPCAHFGKTPPCADLIVQSGLKRVSIACQDPFSKVNGAGIKRLIEGGIDVSIGLLEREAQELNRRFFTFHKKKRPYVILKWAETQDGFVDVMREKDATPLKITCDVSNTLVHKWRAEEAAILIGKNTAIMDDPSLTTRYYKGPDPLRVLLDGNLETPVSSKIFNDTCKTLVINSLENKITPSNEFVSLENIRDVNEVLAALSERNIQSVIVEGGPTVHSAFYKAGVWDEIRRFVAPFKADSGVKALRIDQPSEEELTIGTDRLYIYRNR